jgi:hypothetical protein
LALLPPFLEHTAADHQKRVLAGVERLVSGCFPLSSWEYPPGSTQVMLSAPHYWERFDTGSLHDSRRPPRARSKAWSLLCAQAADYAAQLAAAFGALVQTAEQSALATALLEVCPVLSTPSYHSVPTSERAFHGYRTFVSQQELQPVLMEMGEPKGHTRQASLVTLLARVAAAPWTALPAEVCTRLWYACGMSRYASGQLGVSEVVCALIQGANMTQGQGDAFSAASRRANSLMEYAWLYVFEKASTPAPLRWAAQSA